jgi:uncharacterized protein YmfQ (DUF2313 family)
MDLNPLNYIKKYGAVSVVRQMVDLMPKGAIWNIPYTPSSLWGALLYAFADEVAIWETDMTNLLIEAVPGLSTKLISDWERVLGLPDETYPENPTLEQRRALVHAKYTAKYSGLSIQFYLDLAETFGVTTLIINEEPGGGEPFRVDKNRVDRTPAEDINGARLNSLYLLNTWTATISSAEVNKDILHGLFLKYKPAHTTLIWIET